MDIFSRPRNSTVSIKLWKKLYGKFLGILEHYRPHSFDPHPGSHHRKHACKPNDLTRNSARFGFISHKLFDGKNV